jgi:hypothetical protein
LQVETIMELLPHIFRWTSSCNRKMAWLWVTLYHPSLATSSWSILRNWCLTRRNTNHPCGSGMLMIHLWSVPVAQSSYRMFSPTSIV